MKISKPTSKNPETHILHSATCVSYISHENVESRNLSCNDHASKGALPLYNDEPRIKNPRLRATGLSEHAVTPTVRVENVPEAENCNCNCRSEEACGVTDRDQKETRRRGTCVIHGLFQPFLSAGIANT